MMRSPAFRLSAIVPGGILNGASLASVAEEDGFFLDDDANSEHGSELGPLPATSPANSYTRRLSHHLSSRTIDGHHSKALEIKPKDSPDNFFNLVVFGLVNVALSVPCLYGYSSIIYRDPAFQNAMPDLTKLVILSSAIHQLIFSFKSSLTFSIAQVQDAGLIFLSTMATSIASRSDSEEEAVATAVVVLSVATAALGAVIIVVGKFRLASFVSLIPMPVVAGYLAFIGFFCLAAGIGLSCSKDISTYQDFAQLDESKDWVLAAPAILAGSAMTLVSRRSQQWWALPLTIVIIPLIFYASLSAMGMTLNDARVGGWVAPVEPTEPFYKVFLRFNFAKVKWSLVPKLVFTWASMTLLVTFASALDVVAVEMDLGGHELDLDNELKTVGISNLISGLLGGYTGSYIFSMTIFTRRTGSKTRWIGVILAFVELLLFWAPFNLMSYVPRFFFAATLIFIALDLMMEWLYHVAFRVSYREYFTVLVTFFAITFTEDLVLGILIGCLMAVVNFITLYSSIDPVVPTHTLSNVLRDYEARKILHSLSAERIISLKLSGFLFFGSTTLLLSRVRGFITGVGDVSQSDSAHGSEESAFGGTHKRNTSKDSETVATTVGKTEETPLLGLQSRSKNGQNFGSVAATSEANVEADKLKSKLVSGVERTVLGTLRKRRSASVNDLPALTRILEERAAAAANQQQSSDGESVAPVSLGGAAPETSLDDSLLGSPQKGTGRTQSLGDTGESEEADEIGALEMRRSGIHERKTRYLVLDFFSVTGVDATAVSTGLLRIRMLAKAYNVKVVFASLSPQNETLFRANQVLGHDDVIVKQTLNDALDYCETEMLEEVKIGKEIGNVQQSLKVLQTSRLLRYPREPSVPPVVFDEDTTDPIIVAQKKRAEKRARASLALLVDTFFGWGRGQPSMSPEQSKQLASYFILRAKRHGQVLFDVGEEGDTLYVVLSGEVVLYKVSSNWQMMSRKERQAVIAGQVKGTIFGEKRETLQRARYGSMIGDLSFALQERRAFGAMAERDTTVFVLTRAKEKEMEIQHPELAVGLYKMMGRSLGMTLVNLQQLTGDET